MPIRGGENLFDDEHLPRGRRAEFAGEESSDLWARSRRGRSQIRCADFHAKGLELIRKRGHGLNYSRKVTLKIVILLQCAISSTWGTIELHNLQKCKEEVIF